MGKKLLLTGAVAFFSLAAAAQSIKVYDTGQKWDAQLGSLLSGKAVQYAMPRTARTATADTALTVKVTVTDAEAVATFLKGAGAEADIITDELVVATLSPDLIPDLAGRGDVKYISSTRKFHPLLDKVRSDTKVTEVVTGEGLETPYTGKGVLIGVIDQGFEYQHPAFANRVKRWGINSSSGAFSTNIRTTDPNDDNGHATHVMNIAGGSEVSGCSYYGIATGAELLPVTSNFDDASVLKQVAAIKSYAEGAGMPWVINMSFGGSDGPRDGTTEFNQNMDKLAGAGGIFVAAMGNDGGSACHAYRTITAANTPVYLAVKFDSDNTNLALDSEIWSDAADGKSHLTITPCVYSGGKLIDLTEKVNLGAAYTTGIDAFNNRQYASAQIVLANVLSYIGVSGASSNFYFMWKVEGAAGDSFHAWTGNDSYVSSFVTKGSPYPAKKGDDDYSLSEGSATTGKAVAVASYNVTNTATNISGTTYQWDVGNVGGISNFSSHGPLVGDDTAAKPAVAAPGGVVISAISKNYKKFSATDATVVQSVTYNGKKYYYSVMSGTSMATPAISGIVALWLEANPKLTYDDLITIFKETSRRDAFTGTANADGWNAKAGYGKIDAYAGLKKALELANSSGIGETLNSPAPVSLQKDAGAWRILFNSDESFADISLYGLDGTLVSSRHLDAPRRAQEEVVSFGGLTPGVYLIRIATTQSSLTRKVVVR